MQKNKIQLKKWKKILSNSLFLFRPLHQQTFCGQTSRAYAAGFPGFPGIPGPTGPAGVAGSPGNRGPEGPMGPRGSKGDEGGRGRRGVPGPKGAKELSGPTGAKGSRGEKSARGRPGTPGPKGADGLLVKNWKQCVYKNLNDGRDTGLIKVWIWTLPKSELYKLRDTGKRGKASALTRCH